jgi:hypothetical protein
MLRIQVRRKRRQEPHPRVVKILNLKAKAHFFGVGTLVHGGGALDAFLGTDVAVCAAAGGRCRLRRRHRRNLRLNVQIFGDFGGGDTYGGGRVRCAHRPPPPTCGRSQGKARRA